MYTVFTTLNNSMTFAIFRACILREFSDCIQSFYNARHRYDDDTYSRVFAFVWSNGLKAYYRTVHSLMRDRANYDIEYSNIEREIHRNDLESLNRLIQLYKLKGGVLK